MKAGVKTSEFALTFATLLVMVLVGAGVVPQTDQEHLVGTICSAIVSVGALVTYIHGRIQIKRDDRMVGVRGQEVSLKQSQVDRQTLKDIARLEKGPKK